MPLFQEILDVLCVCKLQYADESNGFVCSTV